MSNIGSKLNQKFKWVGEGLEEISILTESSMKLNSPINLSLWWVHVDKPLLVSFCCCYEIWSDERRKSHFWSLFVTLQTLLQSFPPTFHLLHGYSYHLYKATNLFLHSFQWPSVAPPPSFWNSFLLFLLLFSFYLLFMMQSSLDTTKSTCPWKKVRERENFLPPLSFNAF